MCGRYTLHQKAEHIAARFNLASVPNHITENYNVAPGQTMPVIHQDDMGRHLECMKWGLIPAWAKDPNIGYKLINARDDGIFEKPVWRNLITRKRAIIPADGFYEWKKSIRAKGHKQPFYIHPTHNDLFGFAGVWEVWKNPDGQEIKTYSIITTEPNKEMRHIHNRMPVILRPEDEAGWLSPSHNDNRVIIEAYLRPYEDNCLETFEISSEVNFVKNNNQKLIYPIHSK